MREPPREQAEQAMHERRRIPAWLVLPVMLALVLVGILAGRMTQPPPINEGEPADQPGVASGWLPSPRPQGETVSLTVDFGNGAKRHFADLAWREQMTVLDAMQRAAGFRPGITFAYKGSGKTAFVTAIDGLENGGAGGGNWIYEINGEKAIIGAGVQTLAPGDALLWRYSIPE